MSSRLEASDWATADSRVGGSGGRPEPSWSYSLTKYMAPTLPPETELTRRTESPKMRGVAGESARADSSRRVRTRAVQAAALMPPPLAATTMTVEPGLPARMTWAGEMSGDIWVAVMWK